MAKAFIGIASSAPTALPPPPSHAREERIDRAVALLRALPPELRQEGFRLMHAIKVHSEAIAIRRSLAESAGQGSRP